MRAVELAQVDAEREFGGKAVKLGEAVRAGLPVPPGFAVDVELVEAVARGDRGGHEQVVRAFESVGGPVAVRSSAIGEDSGESSFAGQHLTVLNVTTAAQAVAAVVQVRASAYAASARAYRRRRGLDDAPRMAVVLQKLVIPDCAGVMFTRNPIDGRDERLIEAARGLGESVVAGLVTPDTYRVGRDGEVLEVEVGEQHLAVRALPEGRTAEEPLESRAAQVPCLAPPDLARLHDLATRSEALYGRDLDIEWAIAANRVYLVQSRAITTLAPQLAA